MSGHCCCCQIIKVNGKTARIAAFLPSKGWSFHQKGYLMYTSRSTTSGIKRGTRVHRAALAQMLGAPLPEDKQVHHQDFDKLNNCPRNLVLVDAAFNPAFALRDPYTGEYMSPSVWHRRYGEIRREQEIPDWVVNEQYIESQYATARV